MTLISEGVSDDDFLVPVLQRSAEEFCPADAQVDEPLAVRAAAGPAVLERTTAALSARSGAFRIVVVHHDGANDPEEGYRRWVSRVGEAWRAEGGREPVIGVVPVRETEAWALADEEVLRRIFAGSEPGSVWTDCVSSPPSGAGSRTCRTP